MWDRTVTHIWGVSAFFWRARRSRWARPRRGPHRAGLRPATGDRRGREPALVGLRARQTEPAAVGPEDGEAGETGSATSQPPGATTGRHP